MKVLREKIDELKKERKAVILAHNYQRPEVQDIADFVGDSLGLARKAAKTDAEVIVFCGVHFMAETAYILSPEKTVILPDKNAGCPMADMIDASSLRRFKEDCSKATVVTYVNSSAEVKAESDICCTSSNAVNVVKSTDSDTIIFTPDKNLGRYAADLTDKTVILWKGFCPTHNNIKPDQVTELKKLYPEAVFMAHPECTEDVLDLADYVGSTSQMFEWAKNTQAKTVIVGSEIGMLYKLKKDNPDKLFLPPTADTLCPNMKLITLDKVYEALKSMEPKITVPEKIRLKALSAVEKMLKID